MKRTFALLVGMMICASFAQAGEVKVTVVLATATEGEPATTFTSDTEEIHALFQTKGVEAGGQLRSVWIAEDVGEKAPANTKIDEKTLPLEGDTKDGDFSLSRPDKGWPIGRYRLEIYANDKLVTMARFTIKSSEKEEVESEKPEKASGKSDDDEYFFKVHNTTKDKIKRLLASEDGEEYGPFDVGRAGIAPGQTMTLSWDKSTNNTDCEWYIKAVFADGSETKAAKIDFCEDNVELDF